VVTTVGLGAAVEVDLSVDINGTTKIVTTRVITVKVAKEEMMKTEAGEIKVVDMAGQMMMMRKRTEGIPKEAATGPEQDRPNNPDDPNINQANDIEPTEASQNTIVTHNTLDRAHLGRHLLQKHHSEAKDSELQQPTRTTKWKARPADEVGIMNFPELRICSEKIRLMIWIMT